MTPREEITTWLKLLNATNRSNGSGPFHYYGMADFLLQHGVWYEVTPYPKEVPLGHPQMCFGNSIIVASKSGYRYVEGLAVAPDKLEIAFHHAWNIDAQGKLVDVTWRNLGLAYYGVEFSVERADDATWNGDACVLNDFNRHHPLFRKPWSGEDYSLEWPESPRLQALRDGKEWELWRKLRNELVR